MVDQCENILINVSLCVARISDVGIQFLSQDSRDMAIDITNNIRKAKEKYMVKALTERSTKLEQEIYVSSVLIICTFVIFVN